MICMYWHSQYFECGWAALTSSQSAIWRWFQCEFPVERSIFMFPRNSTLLALCVLQFVSCNHTAHMSLKIIEHFLFLCLTHCLLVKIRSQTRKVKKWIILYQEIISLTVLLSHTKKRYEDKLMLDPLMTHHLKLVV